MPCKFITISQLYILESSCNYYVMHTTVKALENIASSNVRVQSTHNVNADVSRSCKIPDNHQKASVKSTLNETALMMPSNEERKATKKRRLNLKTRGGKANVVEHCVETVLKDTDSSEDAEKQKTGSLKNNSKHHNENEMKAKEVRKENSGLKCCPVCEFDFSNFDDDFKNLDREVEINMHINKCLDGVKTRQKTSSEHCQLCGKDMSHYNTLQRQQHINRCCDKIEKTQPKPKIAKGTSISCPLCGKACKTTRVSHKIFVNSCRLYPFVGCVVA